MHGAKSRRLLLPVLWILSTLVSAPAPARAASRALLMGVNQYTAVPPLRGSVNDVEFLREVLTTRFGFQSKDVETLLDQQATRAGILAALDRLAARSAEGDLVYIHFSGHGSQIKDQNGDEEDGMDETIVPQDGRTPGIPDITDDEIGEKLKAIHAKSVIVVLDSCHSGTATRSLGAKSSADQLLGGMIPRNVPPDGRTELYENLGPPDARSVVPLVSAHHILFTGAAFNEEALDGPVDHKPRGLFSYSLGMSLSRAAPTATPREVFAGVEQEFERIRGQLNLRKMPDPQLEAQKDELDEPLLVASAPAPAPAPGAPAAASGAPARLAWIEVEPLGAGKIKLARGSSLGAGRGSLWAVYPPGETRFAPGQALAQAEVTELKGSDAIAVLAPAKASVPAGARAVALAPPPASSDLPVALVDGDAKRAKALRAALPKRLAGIHFVGNGEFARFVVRCSAAKCRVDGADGLYAIAELDAGDVDALVDGLVNLFARSLTAAELLALDNPSSEVRVKLAVVAKTEAGPAKGDERGMKLVGSGESPKFRIRPDGAPRTRENSLQLRVEPSADCSVTVVDVDSAGTVQVLFPNASSEKKGYHPDGALRAGEELLIPDSLESGNRAGFYIDYAPPIGTDTVRAFCTRDPRAASALRGAIRALDPNAQGTRSTRSAGLSALRQQLAGLASRGLKLVEDVEPAPAPAPPPSPPVAPEVPSGPTAEAWRADWAAASVTIEVRE
jgi:Caspase domain/Domain of unknown function (DUF4384)